MLTRFVFGEYGARIASLIIGITGIGWFGVQTYPPAVLFAVALLFVLAVLLHYSTVMSKLSDQNVILAQRLALLELELSARSEPPPAVEQAAGAAQEAPAS